MSNQNNDENIIRKIPVLPYLIGMVYGKGKTNINELCEEYHLDINVTRNDNDEIYFIVKLHEDEEAEQNSQDEMLIAKERLDTVENMIRGLIKKKYMEYQHHEQIKKKYREEKINQKYFQKSKDLKERILGFRQNNQSNQSNQKEEEKPQDLGLKKNPFYALSSIIEDEEEDDE
jgi:bisphosphoglycerate-independent phosphoglycerate mutase (AlkP superfamily)